MCVRWFAYSRIWTVAQWSTYVRLFTWTLAVPRYANGAFHLLSLATCTSMCEGVMLG